MKETQEELKETKDSNPTSREERKQQKEKKEKDEKPRFRVRLIPIWLRLFLFFALLAGSLAAGLMVGYGVMGGGNAADVFQKETWTHIIDLVKGE
ncbi:hydroxymyristoyl-ACP dehydratase [Bacillus coahuilensis p1.1.43]|uniref:Hydroxymyristoyl-ACP dehydratase n=1 Tax=Bacillus coahuilensis p1.1.43 TaxID=1150625 RepID=A0A147K488_9BACI|nr:DNA-directed RNA polymerase subunit beta [Bacillus coahuilensis]KUP04135.1 hydroxymyristoyl-ACP dehydratase [Bacillus coahuilensis p1.1.43]